MVDATFVVNRLQVLKLRDPDNNNTGMHVWGTEPFAITWGEDSQFAAVGNPFIDAGYTILPLDPSWMNVVLSLDKTVTPPVIPAEIGQVVTSRLVVESSQPLNLNIPSLKVKLPIVGVPFVDGGWDVAWLGNSAGYLQGTAFPTWKGNSVITAHVYHSNGLPGPFANRGTLKWGDKIQVEAYGQVYTYEIRSVYTVRPWDQRPFAHKKEAWLTLITCKEYDIRADNYRIRTIVQAVLISISDPK